MKSLLASPLLVAGLLLYVAQVSATESAKPEADSETLQRVLVEAARLEQLGLDQPAPSASRLNLVPMELPASVEIVSGDAIRARGDDTFVAAVTRATGITNVSSPGTGNAVAARGFGGHTSIMQLYDGTRFFAAASTLTFPFDTWSIDRIEVLHGPASVLHGEGSLGGAINVVPKKPSRIENYQSRISIAEDNTYQLGLGAGGPLGEKFSYRTDYSYRRTDSWFDNGESENMAISGALRWDIADDVSATLMYDHGDQEPAPYFGIPLVEGRLNEAWLRSNFNFSDGQVEWRDDLTRMNVTWRLADGVTLTNDTYYLTSDRHWRNAEAYEYLPEDDLIARYDFLEIYHDQIQRGHRASLAVSRSLFGLANDFSIGFDVNRVSFRAPSNSPFSGDDTVDPDNFVPGRFTSPSLTYLAYQARTEQYSLFFEDRLKLTDRLAVVGGLRYDDMRIERDQFSNVNTGQAGYTFQKGYSPVSWRLGTVFDFTKSFVLFAQYATNAEHLGTLVTSSLAQASYDLTTGEQYEIGIKQIFAEGRGQWTLTVYDLTKYNLLSRDRGNIQQQIGARSSRGVEVAAVLALGSAWTVSANFAALDARYDDFKEVFAGTQVSRDGNTPSGVPERTANAYVTWAFLEDWQAGAGWRYVGKRYTDASNSSTVKAYNVADFNLTWLTTDKVSLTLRLDNAFDEIYVTSADSFQWSIERPRTLQLTADVSF